MFKSFAAANIILAALAGPVAAAQTVANLDETAPAASTVAAPVRALGDEDAPVTLDLFQSLVCFECAVWHRDVLPEIKSAFVDTGQVRILFHDAMTDPVIPSARAGMLGLCAAPAAFYDVVDVFMRGVLKIRDGADNSTFYSDAADVAGRDPEELERCTSSEETYNLLILENNDDRLANFQTFPGIMINGEAIAAPTFENVSAAIAAKSVAP